VQAEITKQSAGFLVDQLESGGYVDRVPDPADGRARLVRVAERGARSSRAGNPANDLLAERTGPVAPTPQMASTMPRSISSTCPGLLQVMTIGYVRTMIMSAQEVLESEVSVQEHVLLGCFGLDLTAVQPKKQLRLALRRAGYPGALAAHLVRESPLLVRQAGHEYRLRRCDEHDANSTDAMSDTRSYKS
jgi:hypothetical protein